MNITIRSSVDGTRNSTGLVVIIDVLRSCTTIPILLKNGASEIIPVKTAEDAKLYKSQGYILIGEGARGSVDTSYDYNNCSSEIAASDFFGKKVVLRSNNGTQSVFNTNSATDIVMASFVNLHAIVDYIQASRLDDITLVALGSERGRGLEDDLCAEAIQKELQGQPYNFDHMKKQIYGCETAILIRETLQKPKDVDIALDINSYSVVPQVTIENNHPIIKVASH